MGGHAVAFHGHPRYTGDIDFLVRPIANTRASGRAKDLADLDALTAIATARDRLG